jgi:hypothetical protein
MSELINYNPDLIQRKIGVRESFEIKCTYVLWKNFWIKKTAPPSIKKIELKHWKDF